VLVIVMENHDFAQVAGQSPYLNRLASRCGLAANSHGVTHPSLPNYLAMTTGDTQGITTDCTSCPTDAPSIFEQVGSDGWRAYQEDMPSVGFTGAASGRYAKKHDPPAYYTSLESDFKTHAVPMGTPESGALQSDLQNDRLPRFAFLTPNLCDDEHDCPVSTGDMWLSGWMAKILESTAYRSGSTAVFVTYDENDDRAGNRIYTVAASTSVSPGSSSDQSFDHYSLLATVEDLLGLGRLGRARHADSMRSAFQM